MNSLKTLSKTLAAVLQDLLLGGLPGPTESLTHFERRTSVSHAFVSFGILLIALSWLNHYPLRPGSSFFSEIYWSVFCCSSPSAPDTR